MMNDTQMLNEVLSIYIVLFQMFIAYLMFLFVCTTILFIVLFLELRASQRSEKDEYVE